jgi:hypothetical protein
MGRWGRNAFTGSFTFRTMMNIVPLTVNMGATLGPDGTHPHGA